MTRYADAGDLDTYGAFPAATSALFTTAQKEAALDEASSFAEGYIAAQVQDLPLTTWGVDLRAAIARKAAWSLLQGLRGYDSAGSGNSYKQRSDDADRWLRDVSKGVVKISGGNTSPSQTNGARVQTRSSLGWYESATAEEEDDW